MAYTILNTDGTTLVLLADNTVDNVSTSLSLVGKNVSSYGEYWNNNLVKLAANFASSSSSPPRNPLKGQLWYDTTSRRLKIYDNGFKSLNGAVVSETQPNELSTGDLWFDSANNQLNLYNNSYLYLVGPAYPKSAGKNGWNLPTNNIRNISSNTEKVSLLYNYGDFVGSLSTTTFQMYQLDSQTYFNNTNTALVSGLTIKGDVQFTGKSKDNYLSLTVDIDKITPSNFDVTDAGHFAVQTNTIIDILNAMFPVASISSQINNPANATSIEPGVVPGSEARVFCMYTAPVTGYQIRRFYSRRDTSGWDYYIIDPVNVTMTNVIINSVSV
jgi:hypothetical protein